MNQSEKWYVYMVRCADGTLYTGITTEIERRLAEHNGQTSGADKGAKYTKVRRPVTLVYKKRCNDRSCAASEEAALRKLSKNDKENLIST